MLSALENTALGTAGANFIAELIKAGRSEGRTGLENFFKVKGIDFVIPNHLNFTPPSVNSTIKCLFWGFYINQDDIEPESLAIVLIVNYHDGLVAVKLYWGTENFDWQIPSGELPDEWLHQSPGLELTVNRPHPVDFPNQFSLYQTGPVEKFIGTIDLTDPLIPSHKSERKRGKAGSAQS